MSSYPYHQPNSILTDPFASENQQTYIHPNPSIHSTQNYSPLPHPLTVTNGGVEDYFYSSDNENDNGNVERVGEEGDPEMVDLSTGRLGNRPLSSSNNTAYWQPENYYDEPSGIGELSPKAGDGIGGIAYDGMGGIRNSDEENYSTGPIGSPYSNNSSKRLPWFKTRKFLIILLILFLVLLGLSLGLGLGIGLGKKNSNFANDNSARLSSMSSVASVLSASLVLGLSTRYITTTEVVPDGNGGMKSITSVIVIPEVFTTTNSAGGAIILTNDPTLTSIPISTSVAINPIPTNSQVFTPTATNPILPTPNPIITAIPTSNTAVSSSLIPIPSISHSIPVLTTFNSIPTLQPTQSTFSQISPSSNLVSSLSQPLSSSIFTTSTSVFSPLPSTSISPIIVPPLSSSISIQPSPTSITSNSPIPPPTSIISTPSTSPIVIPVSPTLPTTISTPSSSIPPTSIPPTTTPPTTTPPPTITPPSSSSSSSDPPPTSSTPPTTTPSSSSSSGGGAGGGNNGDTSGSTTAPPPPSSSSSAGTDPGTTGPIVNPGGFTIGSVTRAGSTAANEGVASPVASGTTG